MKVKKEITIEVADQALVLSEEDARQLVRMLEAELGMDRDKEKSPCEPESPKIDPSEEERKNLQDMVDKLNPSTVPSKPGWPYLPDPVPPFGGKTWVWYGPSYSSYL